MAIDYSALTGPVAENGTTKGLAMFGDALQAVLQRRAMMQQQQQQIDAQKEAAALVDKRAREMQAETITQQQAAQQRIAEHEKAMEKQGQDTLAMQRQARQAEVMGKVPDLVAKGQSAAVPGLLQSAGIDYSQKQAPEELRRPIENPMAAVSGMPFMGMADVTGGAAQQMEAKRQQQVKGIENTGVMDFGDGRTADIDMQAMGPEARAEAMRKALDRLPADNPFVAQAKNAIPLMTAGGMVKPGEENSMYRDATREAAALERAKIAADAAGKRQNTERPGQVKDDARADIALIANQLDVKGLQASRRQFDKMSAMGKAAADGKNAIAAQAFMGMYTKFAQGEVGVLNKSDIDTFWTNAGSPEERTQEALERILSGGIGADKREKALQAIDDLRGVIQGRLDEAHSQAATVMEPYGEQGDRYLRGIFGKGLPKMEKARTADKAKSLLDSSGF